MRNHFCVLFLVTWESLNLFQVLALPVMESTGDWQLEKSNWGKKKKKHFQSKTFTAFLWLSAVTLYPRPRTSPFNSSESLWSETQMLILQQSSIRCCLHHGGAHSPASWTVCTAQPGRRSRSMKLQPASNLGPSEELHTSLPAPCSALSFHTS